MEPISATVITALVSLMTGYMQYRATVETAQQSGAPKPEKPAEADQGEHALTVVRDGIATHGNADEQADLASFERNPPRNRGDLERAMTELAQRSVPFAQQLQTLAQQADIQTGGMQGNVNVSDQGKIYGTATGVNTGTISGTYTFNDHDEDKT
jgi:hypothetical protein